MIRRTGMFCTLALVLSFAAGCRNMPEDYAPPEQFPALPPFRPYQVSRMVTMADSNVSRFIVRDIQGNSGTWRWTGQHPAIHLTPHTAKPLSYRINFTIADATFKDTGPVTIRFTVNDHILDEVRYTTPGSRIYEKPVPTDWLTPERENTLGADLDKVWTSPLDGNRLGIILTSIGLVETHPEEPQPAP